MLKRTMLSERAVARAW
jgi:hypothetical protein